MSIPAVAAHDCFGGVTPTGRTATLILRCINEDANVGPQAVMGMAGVPRIWDTYANGSEADDRLFCISKDAKRRNSPKDKKLWFVTCQYQTLTPTQKERKKNPLQRRPEVSTGGSIFSAICDRDIFGEAILNTAGVPFDPPAERDDARIALTVTRNFPGTYDTPAIDTFAWINRVNSTAWRGAGAEEVKIMDIQQTFESEEFETAGIALEVEFWRSTVFFEYNPHGWQLELENLSRMELDANGDLDVDNARAVPYPLDQQGRFITDPSTLPGAAITVDRKRYFTANFNQLGLFA